MATSSGRKFAQDFIDVKKQYGGQPPAPDQIRKALDSVLPPERRYTDKGFSDLLTWLKGWKK
jgi:coenzyme F420-reducing hydrogenase gamma subunit